MVFFWAEHDLQPVPGGRGHSRLGGGGKEKLTRVITIAIYQTINYYF